MRAAIRPDTSPQIYLPDRFKDDTTELADGTLVMLDEYNRPVRIKAGRYSLGEAQAAYEAEDMEGDESLPASSEDEEQVRIEVAESIAPPEPDAEALPTVDLSVAQDQKAMVAAEEEEEEIVETPEDGEVENQLTTDAEQVMAAQPAKPQLAPWEIRQEDLPREEEEEDPETAKAAGEGTKPLSRAERRRLIKEEIQRLAQGDEPMYYQRRLW